MDADDSAIGWGISQSTMNILFCAFLFYQMCIAPCVFRWVRNTARMLYRWWYPDPTDPMLSLYAATFHNPQALVRGMEKANLTLSGHHALRFFLTDKHISGLDPIWDFYTYPSPYCIGLSLDVLSKAGVEWKDRWEPIRQLLQTPPSTLCPMHIETIERFVCENNLNNGVRPSQEIKAAIKNMELLLQDNKDARILELDCGVKVKVVRVKPGEQPYTDDMPATVVEGAVRTSCGTSERVRLIFRPQTSPIQHILAFESSAAQCLVTAFGAVHLYYKVTESKKSYLWRYNSSRRTGSMAPSIGEGMGGDQGWRLVYNHPDPADGVIRQRRTVSDRHCKFVPFEVPALSTISDELRTARIYALKNICWEVSEGETRFLRSEPRSLRELLWDTHRDMHGIEDGEKPQWLSWALERAREQCIALPVDADPQASVPDELSGI